MVVRSESLVVRSQSVVVRSESVVVRSESLVVLNDEKRKKTLENKTKKERWTRIQK